MKKQSFLKGSAILVGMVVITKALGLLYKIPLANILGGTGMGYFSAAFSVFTPVFSIVAAGIPSAMSRLAAENAALGRFSNLRKQKRVAHLTFALFSLCACVLMILAAEPLGSAAVKEPAVKYALICIAPSVVFCSIMNVERGYYEGLSNMLPTALSEVAETVFKIVLGLGLALFTERYALDSFEQRGRVFGIACRDSLSAHDTALPFIAAAAILGSTLASGIACLMLLVGAKIKGDGITEDMLKADPVTDSRRRHAKTLLTLSLSIAFAAVITTMTGMIDMLTIAPCIKRAALKSPHIFEKYYSMGVSPRQLPTFMYGSYEGLAMLIYGLVPTLTAMFGKSALPSLSDAWARRDKAAFAESLQKMMTVSAVIAIPSGLGICVLARPALMFLFAARAAEVEAAAEPLAIMGLSVVFFGLSLPCFTVIQTLGKPAKAAAVIAAGGVIKLLLNLALISIPEINLSGAAVSELVSSAFVCVLTLREVYKLGGVRCSLLETYIKPLYAGVMCAVSARLTYDFIDKWKIVPVNYRLVTLTAVTFGGIMYFISLYLLCETPKNIIKYAFSKKK